ncbi:MAG: OmpA family protein [Mariprofundales bacterium]
MMRKLQIGFIFIMLLAMTGCVTTAQNKDTKNTREGAATGALMGAVIGGIVGYKKDPSGGALRGALVGAAAGGALGAAAGSYMDKQQAEFERQLAAEQRAHDIEIERLQNETLKITMNNEVSFDFNSASVKPAFGNTLNKVSGILSRYNKTHLQVVGHTDSIGSESYNQKLSEARARSVSHHLVASGVQQQRIGTEGRGEWEPRASNQTEAGRQLNRRVELLVIPNK